MTRTASVQKIREKPIVVIVTFFRASKNHLGQSRSSEAPKDLLSLTTFVLPVALLAKRCKS